MRFIHTADIHLDSPLIGLSAYEDAPAKLLRTASREAFENLVSEAIAEEVDFVVIAGDLYDGDWKDFNTGIFFARQMGRLNQAGIPVYVLFGNHDAESETTKRLMLPSNVHKFPSNKAATFKLPELRVALHGRSFKHAATTENLAVNYPAPASGWFNIGVLHTALEGNSQHANYAPCSIAELEAKGYQYWALGHVHEHWIQRGKSTIAFPGNLQGRHIREAGPRGALMVTADGTEIQSVERLLVDVLRWQPLEVDVSEASNLQEAIRLIGQSLETLVSEAEGNLPSVVRVTLIRASPAHGELFGMEAQLRAEVLAYAASLGSDRLWIEKVRVETSAHETPDQIAARADAVADLQALVARAESDPDFVRGLEADLMQLVGRVPLEVARAVPQLDAIRTGKTQDLLRSTAPFLIAHVAKAR